MKYRLACHFHGLLSKVYFYKVWLKIPRQYHLLPLCKRTQDIELHVPIPKKNSYNSNKDFCYIILVFIGNIEQELNSLHQLYIKDEPSNQDP